MNERRNKKNQEGAKKEKKKEGQGSKSALLS
jgi:hypothetical protein